MGKRRNRKGQFAKPGEANAGLAGIAEIERIGQSIGSAPVSERTEPERHAEVERIVEAFTEAVKAPALPVERALSRWAWPVVLAITVVAGALLEASQLKPQIVSLQSRLVWVSKQYQAIVDDRARLEGIAGDEHATNAILVKQNAALTQQSEANVMRWSDDEAIMHAASHEVQRAEDAVQTWLNMDQLDNREQAIKVRRALERAEKRLR